MSCSEAPCEGRGLSFYATSSTPRAVVSITWDSNWASLGIFWTSPLLITSYGMPILLAHRSYRNNSTQEQWFPDLAEHWTPPRRTERILVPESFLRGRAGHWYTVKLRAIPPETRPYMQGKKEDSQYHILMKQGCLNGPVGNRCEWLGKSVKENSLYVKSTRMGYRIPSWISTTWSQYLLGGPVTL